MAANLLPPAVAVAVSPVPIIAVILMLLAPNAVGSSTGFLAGWILGIAGASTAFVLLANRHQLRGEGSSTIGSWAELVFGLLLLLLAGRQLRTRHGPSAEPGNPKWLATIHQLTPAKAAGLGIALSAANPKILLLCVAAGAAIAEGDATSGEKAGLVVLFTALAASSVAFPVVAYAVTRRRMADPLQALRRWLTAHNAAVTAGLLLAIGVTLVGYGLRGLT